MSLNKELNFLPGPVCIAEQVQKAFMLPSVSHRDISCLAIMAQIQNDICQHTHAKNAQIILGSGTLANEIVAAQLSLLEGSGLIVANGEFGERLMMCARRAQLQFQSLKKPWGETFDLDEIEQILSKLPPKSWLWVVHHETSTGMLNPLEPLKALCLRYGIYLCLDCISSVGAIPVNLDGVYLATAVSGKGIGSYPGLSIVFHRNVPALQTDRLPAYLDLGNWAANHSIPYTHSSNLLSALAEAIKLMNFERMEQIRINMLWLRAQLTQYGLKPLITTENFSPAVVTIEPEGANFASWLGHELEKQGYWLSFKSAYLQERNWIQISLLGNPPKAHLESLLQVIGGIIKR